MGRVQEWFAGPIGPGFLIAAGSAAIAVWLWPVPRATDPSPRIYVAEGALEKEQAENLVSHAVGAYGSASVHHVRVRDRVPPHYHRTHDETVVVLAGRGRVTIGGEAQTIEPGTVLMIPRGVVHSFEVAGEPAEAVSVFSPPFDGKDREFVE